MRDQADSPKRELFVWRDSTWTWGPWGSSGNPNEIVAPSDHELPACPFCQGELTNEETIRSKIDWERRSLCRLCGFWRKYSYLYIGGEGWAVEESLENAILRRMDINSAELGMNEIGAHLRRHPEDALFLTPRRWEELVADVYSQLGFHVRLTQQTRDGGYDIALLERSSGNQVIVECKRYTDEHKVTVRTVREILGVQLIRGIKKGKIITTTGFSLPARNEAIMANSCISGYELELVDIEEFTRALQVYNTQLPPLSLSQRVLAQSS